MIKTGCILLFCLFMCYAKSTIIDKKWFVGNPWEGYECVGLRNAQLELNQQFSSGDKLIIFRENKSQVPEVRLKIEKLFEFDNGSSLTCLFQSSSLEKTKNSTYLMKITPRRTSPRQNNINTQNYSEGNNIKFDCDRQHTVPYQNEDDLDSLHWIKVEDNKVSKILKSNFAKASITYTEKMKRDHNGSKLVCIHVQCERYRKGPYVSCVRHVLKETVLQFTPGNMEEYDNNNCDDRYLEIGKPFHNYEYDGRDGVHTEIYLKLLSYETDKEADNVLHIATANNRTVQLEFSEIYAFDKGLTIIRLMQDNTHHKNTFSTKIILRPSEEQQAKYRNYTYKVDDVISFSCTRTKETKWKDFDSLHWIKFRDKNIGEVVESNYSNRTIIYTAKLAPEHNGLHLICFYFECDENEKKKEIKCIRHVLDYTQLKLCKDNCSIGFQTDGESTSPIDVNKENDDEILGAIAGLSVVIILLLAAVIWYWWRKRKVKVNTNSTVQYIEVEFDTTSSNRPTMKDEIIYSEVMGVICPAKKREGIGGTSDNFSTDKN